MVVMFVLPPLMLVGLIAAISALGFMTDALIGPILGWGLVVIIIAYIAAGMVASYIGTPSSNGGQNNERN